MFKNTASQKVTLLAIDTAANTPKTGDSANLTAYVSKDDGAVSALTDTSAAELDATNAPGLYTFDVSQSETNADKLVFSGKSSTSGVRLVPVTIYTRPPNFSGLSISGGVVNANAVQISGDSTAADNLEAAADGTGYNLGGGSVVAASVTGAVGSVTGNVGGNVTGSVGSIGGTGLSDIEATIFKKDMTAAYIGEPSDSFRAYVNLIRTNTNVLIARIPNGIFTGMTNLAQWLGLLAGKQTGDSTARTELRATGAGSGTYDETTDSLEALKDNGIPTTTSIPTAAAIADQVWEEAIADHEGTAGSTAEALAQAGGSGASAADIADAVWDEDLSGHATSGTGGALLTRTDSNGQAIKAKTDNLPSDPADQSAVEAAITAAQGVVTTAISALNDLSAAEVNAEVVDALATDTYAEPTSVPAATSSLKDKIGYLFTRVRNKREQTSSTETIYQDDAATVLATASKADDGTTLTKGEDTTA
jgi:hypothetical protein